MRLYEREGTWYADIRHGGKRYRRSCGAGTRREAEDAARRILIALAIAPPELERTLYDCLLAWLQAEDRGRTDKSIVRQIRVHYPDRPAGEVSDETLRKSLAHLSPGNFNRYVSVVRAALRLTAPNPPRISKRKVNDKRLRFLSEAEWHKLRAKLPAHLLPMVEFSLATGLRQANVLGLQWDQINLQNRTVTVWADVAKMRKLLHLPLSDWAVRVLRAQIGQHLTHVFTYRGQPIASPKTSFRAAMEAAGIRDFTWHGLRHTWASWAVQAGTPLPVLKDLGGWESMDMVMRYAHLAPSHLAEYRNAVRAPKPRHKKAQVSGRSR